MGEGLHSDAMVVGMGLTYGDLRIYEADVGGVFHCLRTFVHVLQIELTLY